MKDKNYLLAVDTSGKTVSVALIENNIVIANYTQNTGNTHSEIFLPLISQMLTNVKLDITDIDAYAVSNGPGSFTGLRIGASSIKAIAHAEEKPLFSVSSLHGLAYNILHFNGLVCPIMDCRREEVYTSVFENDNVIIDDCDMKLADLLDKLDGKNVMFLGDGVIYKDKIIEQLGDKAHFAPPHLSLQNASSIGLIAYEKFQNGEKPSYIDFEISYVKDSQPEQKLKGK